MSFMEHLGELRTRIVRALRGPPRRPRHHPAVQREDRRLPGPAHQEDGLHPDLHLPHRGLLGADEGRPHRGALPGRPRHPLAGVALRRARAARAREEVRLPLHHRRLAALRRGRGLLAVRGDAVRAELPPELRAARAAAHDHPAEPRGLPVEVHGGLRRGVRAAPRHHGPRPHGRGEREDAGQESQVRHPGRLHRRPPS